MSTQPAQIGSVVLPTKTPVPDVRVRFVMEMNVPLGHDDASWRQMVQLIFDHYWRSLDAKILTMVACSEIDPDPVKQKATLDDIAAKIVANWDGKGKRPVLVVHKDKPNTVDWGFVDGKISAGPRGDPGVVQHRRTHPDECPPVTAEEEDYS